MTSLTWKRRKGIGGLYAPLPDDRRYDITMAEEGYDLALWLGNQRLPLGRFSKQVDAKRAAESLAQGTVSTEGIIPST